MTERLRRPIVLWGAGGHARVVADTLLADAQFELMGFLDDQAPERWGRPFEQATVLGGRALLPDLLGRGVWLMLAFGDNAARLAIGAEMRTFGFQCPVLKHPSAVIARSCTPGSGTFIAAGAIVNAGALIGAQAIINTGAIVEHDCRVGDGAHVSPRACLAGGVSIGRAAWIGAGAVVRDGVAVGDGAIVGMGAVVLRDVPERVVAYGNPARIVRRIDKEPD